MWTSSPTPAWFAHVTARCVAAKASQRRQSRRCLIRSEPTYLRPLFCPDLEVRARSGEVKLGVFDSLDYGRVRPLNLGNKMRFAAWCKSISHRDGTIWSKEGRWQQIGEPKRWARQVWYYPLAASKLRFGPIRGLSRTSRGSTQSIRLRAPCFL